MTPLFPPFSYITESRVSSIEVFLADILSIINGLHINEASSYDDGSVNMIKLCGNQLR